MSRVFVLTGFLAVSLITTPVLAWYEVGHMLTMLVAYKQLSPGDTPSDAVGKLVTILRNHPRFEEDFASAMPKGLNDDGQARWLLCRAAVWPDMVRGNRDNPPSYPPEAARKGSFHRGVWHYIDTPLLIVDPGTNAETVKTLDDKARAAQDLAAVAPTEEANVKNVLQAIAFNRERLTHGKADERAVALCWLLHTISDLHQPCHATAAFTVKVLDLAGHPHGDAGANLIRLGEHRNLHSIWDAAPDASPDRTFDPAESIENRYNRAYDRAQKQIDALLASPVLREQGKTAAAKVDPSESAQESSRHCEREGLYGRDPRTNSCRGPQPRRPSRWATGKVARQLPHAGS